MTKKEYNRELQDIRFNRVLVIDDNKIDLFISQRIMEIAYFSKEIIFKESIESALDFLSNDCKTKQELPDFIFLDLFMPKQTGHDFLDAYAKKSKVIREKCKVIILSILIYEDEVQRLLKNRDVYMILRKPLTLESLNALKELYSIQLKSRHNTKNNRN